jgi:phospholipid/cholesterol/gamma-HCH transport system ATP-binding protein
MIRFEAVTKQFGRRKVLDGISFEIRKGEVFVIVGSSGTGKSVTLKHMVRLLAPTAGRVLLDDTVVNEAYGADLERLRERFGYLFQGGALLAWMNVFENVALPLREKTHLGEDQIARKVQDTLAMVGLENDGQKMPSEISGGMQKRAGLARAIVRDPEIVLYDEPTSGLDPVTARMIDQLIARLNSQIGITSVVVTHDLYSALTIGDRIAMLKDGKVAELSPPLEFRKSRNPVVREFLDAQFITSEAQAGGF